MTRVSAVPTFTNVITRPGITSRVADTIFGGIGTVGAVLDTPGSVVRGLANAAFNDGEWERAFTGFFDVSERVSGSELIGHDPSKFTWSGLAVEILTDPTTYLTLGTKTAAGQLAKTAGKLEAKVAAQRALAEGGSKLAAKKLAQNEARLAKVESELLARGRKADERLAKSIREQFELGQRAALQVDIPFTNIQHSILRDIGVTGRVVGGVADTVSAKVGETKIAKGLRKRFITTRKDPIEEALRKEVNSEIRYGTQKARTVGHELTKKRLMLQAKDPDVDLKIARVVEEGGDALDLPLEPIKGFKRLTQVEKMLKARLRVEELYGKTDNFDDVWAFAQQLRKLNKDLLADEQSAGVAVTGFTEFGYLARVITPEGAALLRNSKTGRDLIFNHIKQLDAGPTKSFQKARSFRALGLEDLNKALAKKYGKDPESFKFFDTDVVSIQVNRMIDSSKQIGRARFSQAVVKLFGQERAADLIKAGKQIGVEDVISVRGPLLTTFKLSVETSGAKLAEYLVKRRVPAERLSQAGVRLAGYEFEEVTNETVKAAYALRTKAAFRKISPQHARLDDRFLHLVKNKSLTPTQHRFLRTFFAQVEPKYLDDLQVRAYTEQEALVLSAITGKSYENAKGLGGGAFDETKHLADPTANKPGAFLEQGLALDKANTHRINPAAIFLHEFAHAYHLGYMRSGNPALYDEVNKALKDALKTARVSQEFKNNFIQVAGSSYGLKNFPEVFATLFASWSLGERTSNATLEKIFKQMSWDLKNFRDGVFDVGRFIDPDEQLGAITKSVDELGEASDIDVLTEEFADLFTGVTRDNAEIINSLPAQAKKSFFSDLLEPVHSRRNTVEFAPNATKREVRESLYAAGVVKTALPAEVAEFATDFLAHSKYHLDSDAWWAKTIRVMDEMHGLYRTALTKYFPAFHARNLISNMFMNSMAGINNPRHYFNAFTRLQKMEPEEALYLAGLGVIDSGKIREVFEFMEQTKGGISRFMKDVLGKVPGAAPTGRAVDTAATSVGHGIENLTRYAHFLAKKAEGLSDTEAADSVIKYLFDYSDLTDFEKAVPRRTMLFYTFFRKNMPLMLEQTFKNPRFMLLYARATGNTNPNITQPEWLPDSFFFGDDEQGRQVRLNFGLPPEDLARFDPQGDGLARVFEIMIASLVPIIREPYQFVSGRDAFLGRPQEGGLTERTLAALPTSRAVGTASRISESLQGNNPNITPAGEAFRFVSGIGVRPINLKIQEQVDKLEMIDNRLKALVRSGDARKIEIFATRKGQENPEIAALNSMAQRIRRTIAEQQGRV